MNDLCEHYVMILFFPNVYTAVFLIFIISSFFVYEIYLIDLYTSSYTIYLYIEYNIFNTPS